MGTSTPDTEEQMNGNGNGRVTYRDVSEGYARLEKMWGESVSRLEGKIDGYMTAHETKHAQENQMLQQHLLNSAVMGERGKTMTDEMAGLKEEVESLRDWRSEMRGMAMLVKFAFGASLISAIVGILTLMDMLKHTT